jgi:hypothetical protein
MQHGADDLNLYYFDLFQTTKKNDGTTECNFADCEARCLHSLNNQTTRDASVCDTLIQMWSSSTNRVILYAYS